ncbi:MAG: YraN family protein [Helicobacter sp.]|nr:YraN family protein [Helicobacter sp.]
MFNKDSKQSTMQKGREAESFACAFLEKKGFSILERNFYTRFGELDIIAQKGEVLYFVEVKSGVGFMPVYNLSPTKIQHLQKAIAIYLNKKRSKNPYYLSAVILTKQTQAESFSVEWLENLTLY